MTPNRETTTYNDAPENFENNLRTVLISGIMELSNEDCKEIIAFLKERNML